MRRVPFFSILALLALALLSPAAGAQEPAGASGDPTGVRVVKVSGALDEPLVDFFLAEMESAEDAGETVVIQLDTAGTLDQDALALADRVAGAKVPVIVFVGPTPAKATGAGLLFMYASSLTGVAPGSQAGPLEPLDLAFPDREIADLESTVRGWLQVRGKSTTDPGLPTRPLPAQGALDAGIAQLAAPSVPELLQMVDGREVVVDGTDVALRTALRPSADDGDRVVWSFTDLGPVKRVFHAMVSPSAIYLLLVFGLAALAFESTQPGFGFAGFGGVGMLALAVYGLTVVPFDWLGLALLVGGVGLMVLDVRLRRLGPLSIGGLLVFLVGSVLLFRGVSSQIDLSAWQIGALTLASLLYYGFALTVAVQSRDRITSTQRGLVGLVGEARGDLHPEGAVYVKGTLWRGRAVDGEIERGTPIRVKGVDGLVLQVVAAPGAAIPEP